MVPTTLEKNEETRDLDALPLYRQGTHVSKRGNPM